MIKRNLAQSTAAASFTRAGVVALAMMMMTAPVSTAQTTTPETETEIPGDPTIDSATGLSMGAEVTDEAPIGSTYVAEAFGAWEMNCTRTGTGADPCQLYQLLQDDQENSVAEISIFGLPAGQQAAAGATIITPLETLLTSQITLRVDSGQAKRYPFTFCAAMGCVARIGFTTEEVNSFKRGNQAMMFIVPALAPDQQVPITISLVGFTAGFDAVNKANEAADAAADAAAKASEAAE